MMVSPTQPVVPVEPASSTLVDAWVQEVAAPQGQVNPAIPSALPDSQVFSSSSPSELVPPLATQLPQQAPEAQQAVVQDVVRTAPAFSQEPATTSENSAPSEPSLSDLPLAPSSPPGDALVGDGNQLGDAPAPEGGDDKKTPLEILEEILAGANAEKDLKEKEEAELKAKAEQEAAEFAAKEAAFEEEAKVKLAETSTAIAEAVQHREKVEAELAEKAPKTDIPESLEIHQLDHDTIQTTE